MRRRTRTRKKRTEQQQAEKLKTQRLINNHSFNGLVHYNHNTGVARYPTPNGIETMRCEVRS